MRFIILTGTSGAGKMTAQRYFDDIGYYAVDNVPPGLLPEMARICQEEGRERILAVVDTRAGAPLANMPAILDRLTLQRTPAEILFLDANDETLIRRFKETRRPHPIFEQGRGSILDAIQAERALLDELRARADKVIDTSTLTPAELTRSLADVTGELTGPKFHITVESFGFKHGLPLDADLVFDVRFLANPHYVPELKPLTGMSPEVVHYIHQDPLTEPFLEKMFALITFSLPQYQREGKAYLTIAIGCTGGRHRSVAISEELGDYLRREGYRVSIYHRDTQLEPERYLAPVNPAPAAPDKPSMPPNRPANGAGCGAAPTEPAENVAPSSTEMRSAERHP
jgi:UPF0042 nucleotide-binding protein